MQTAQGQTFKRGDIPAGWECLSKECATCKGIEDCPIFAIAAEAHLA